MNDLIFYFTEGWKHIISYDAFDHQLFILALTIIYTMRNWKKVLILVTAFTIGHSVTLALSVFDIIRLNSAWVEFLIPLTIVITALWNIFSTRKDHTINTNYFLAMFFGLVHGLGFANSIRMMLASDQSLAMGLLGFNIGLEVGQTVLVFIILLITRLVVGIINVPQKAYIFTVSIFILIISTGIAFKRLPFFT